MISLFNYLGDHNFFDDETRAKHHDFYDSHKCFLQSENREVLSDCFAIFENAETGVRCGVSFNLYTSQAFMLSDDDLAANGL